MVEDERLVDCVCEEGRVLRWKEGGHSGEEQVGWKREERGDKLGL